MSTSKISINESTLASSLNELAHAFVRDLAMACRKVSIYGPDHPMGIKAVEKPFFSLNCIFEFRNHVNLNLERGILYALNIRLKQSLFTDEITRYMQVLETETVLFNCRVTITELARFIERFVKRVDLSSHDNLLSTYLEKNGITTIKANTEMGLKLFESQNKYHGDSYSDFSVRNLALQQLGDSLETLVDINQQGQTALDERGIDFTLEVINYLIPERFAAHSTKEIIKKLKDFTERIITVSGDNVKKDNLLASYKTLYSLVDYHPEREVIISELEEFFSTNKLSVEVTKELSSPMGVIRVTSSEHIDELLQQLLSPGNDEYDTDEYGRAFQRLLKTGQRSKATDITLHLLELFSSPDSSTRQKTLQLLVVSIAQLDLITDIDVFKATLDKVIANLSQRKETFAYSEVIWCLLDKCLVARRFDLMARLINAMALRRQLKDNVTLYDSMAVKKAFESLNRREVIETLLDNMIRADYNTSCEIREVLISIGSEEVAIALSNIISYPLRQVRQQALKVLAELGKASLKVFSRMLMDDTMFERESGRHELPDGKWYIVRNSIFVLGSLADPAGVASLRLRMNDNDVRVRREIISALEKIGGEDACDLLILMADDPVREIRERAVIAVGLIGAPEIAPQLFDLTRRNPSVMVRVVSALGKIGGEEARAYLVRLIEDDKELSELASNQVSKEELRLAAIKSLGKIGDEKSIASIREYKDRLSPAKKIFLKNSPLNKAISEILSKY